ncbi:MAG: SusC/RagA family TonB-linked outer membrane protein, partial [Bacteroidota bacterium]
MITPLDMTVFRTIRVLVVLLIFLVAGPATLATAQEIASVQKMSRFELSQRVASTRTFSLDLFDASAEDALRALASKTNYRLSYQPQSLPSHRRVTLSMRGVTPEEALHRVVEELGITYEVANSGHVVLRNRPEPVAAPIEELQHTVSGNVTDAESGNAMPGVNVRVKGTTIGTITNALGDYQLVVPTSEETLVFSFVGFLPQEVAINGRETIDVALETDVAGLEELVVVGYGVQRRSDVTGSVGIASPADIEQPTFNVLQSLRGKVAGVTIFSNSGSPSGSNRVIIRGVGSINASSDPLYVVDGVAMRNIETLNPSDIASIEVLKDASATAIYGARGANGVILITTRRGGNEGIVVGYNSEISAGHMLGRMDVMNAAEFMEVQRIGIQNAPLFNTYDPGREPFLDLSDRRLFDENGNPLYDTDWQAEATRTAVSHNHQLSLQYGGEVSSLGAFLNYTDRQGILLNSYMQRASLRVAYDVTPTSWLSLGTNMTINRTWENNIEEGGGGHEVRRVMIEMPPIFPVRWPDGTWTNSTQANGFTFEGQPNPVHRLLEEDRLRDRTRLYGNTYAAFQLTPHLQLRSEFGLDVTDYEARNYGPSNLIAGGFPDGNASIVNSESMFWQSENYLTYQQEFGVHRLNSVLGASWQQNIDRGNGISARGFSDDFFRFNNIGTATDFNPPWSWSNDWTMNSYFTRVSYTYANKYMATATGRIDGSSRYGADSKYGIFPSIGVAWLVSNEPFMASISAIDQLRLRTSYGVTGNSEIGLYQSLATIGSGTTLIGGGRVPSSFVQRLPNPDLEWEKTHQY